MTITQDFDAIIIGSGLVGTSLELMLAQQQKRIALIDKKALEPINADGRKIALSYGSQQILHHFDLWPGLASQATPIAEVHISKQHQYGITHLTANAAKLPALGWVLPAEHLHNTLLAACNNNKQITCFAPANVADLNAKAATVKLESGNTEQWLTAQLIIAADGALSPIRQQLDIATDEEDYQQSALVTSIELKYPHQHIAYQRFSQLGTLAALPMQDHKICFIVTSDNHTIDKLWSLDETHLLTELHNAFSDRLGPFIKLGKRFRYPLKCIIAKQAYVDRVLLMGNAAHNISPVAAQGFNLALQDNLVLSQLWQTHTTDIEQLLMTYQKQRRKPQHDIIDFTQQLMRFGKNTGISSIVTGSVLGLLDKLPPFKKHITERAAGISVAVKRLRDCHD